MRAFKKLPTYAALLFVGFLFGSHVQPATGEPQCDHPIHRADAAPDAEPLGASDRGLIRNLIDERLAEHFKAASDQLDNPNALKKLGAGEKVGGPMVDAILAFVWKAVKAFLIVVVYGFLTAYKWHLLGSAVTVFGGNWLIARAAGKSGARAEMRAAK